MKTFIKILSILLCLCFCLSVFAACGSCSGKKDEKKTQEEREEEAENVQTNEDTYKTSGVIVGQFTDKEVKSEEDAIAAIQSVADELGLSNATDELTAKSTNTVDNLTYYKVQQNYKGIPVYGSTFVVVTDENGKTQGLSGNVADVDESISLTPTVTQDQVEESIRTYVSEYISDDIEISIPTLTDDMLVVYNYDDVEKAMLAYEMYFSLDGEYYTAIFEAFNAQIIKIFFKLIFQC